MDPHDRPAYVPSEKIQLRNRARSFQREIAKLKALGRQREKVESLRKELARLQEAMDQSGYLKGFPSSHGA